jgi:hypothetical protein
MKHWLSELLGVRLRDLPGATVSGSIPLSDDVVNTLIADRLSPGAMVREVIVESHDGNRLSARVRLTTPFVPTLTIDARIDQQPDLARADPLVLRWTVRGLAVAAPVAVIALRRLGKLPPWLSVESGAASVDIQRLVEARGFGEIIPYVAALRVSSAEGRIILEFELRA